MFPVPSRRILTSEGIESRKIPVPIVHLTIHEVMNERPLLRSSSDRLNGGSWGAKPTSSSPTRYDFNWATPAGQLFRLKSDEQHTGGKYQIFTTLTGFAEVPMAALARGIFKNTRHWPD